MTTFNPQQWLGWTMQHINHIQTSKASRYLNNACRGILVWLYLRHVITWYMIAECYLLGQALWFFGYGFAFCTLAIAVRLFCQLISSYVTTLPQRLFFITVRCVLIWFGVSYVIITNTESSTTVPKLLLYTTVVPGIAAILRKFVALRSEQNFQPVVIADQVRFVLEDQARFSICLTIIFLTLMIAQAYLPIGVLFSWMAHTWAWYFIHSEISSYVLSTWSTNQVFLRDFMTNYFNSTEQDLAKTPLGNIVYNWESVCIIGTQPNNNLLIATTHPNDQEHVKIEEIDSSSEAEPESEEEDEDEVPIHKSKRHRRVTRRRIINDSSDEESDDDDVPSEKITSNYDKYENDHAYYLSGVSL